MKTEIKDILPTQEMMDKDIIKNHGIVSKRSQDLVDYCVVYTGVAHAEQKQLRHYTHEPYIVHPIAVARRMAEFTEDVDAINAAIMHDLIEDTFISYKHINNRFGFRAADMVQSLSEFSVMSDGNRAKRKALDARYLGLQGHLVQTIKCIDMIDNSISILEHDPNFAKIFMVEKRELLEYLTKADDDIWQDAKDIVDKYFGTLKLKP